MSYTRREFMKTVGVGAAVYLSPTLGAKSAKPPNIILVITDDQGFGDLGFHGNPDIQTPVLDDLARQSVRFQNFYVSPVCAPTRASLMTGRYCLRTGVFDTYNGGAIMAEQEKTLAEVLNSAGYATGIFGKWHLGDNYPFRPMDRGFQQSLTHPGGGIGQVGDVRNYFKFDKSYFDPVLSKNGQPFPDMNEREIEAAKRIYAMVSNIDDNLGRLLRALDQLDLSSSTAVIFLTDNGPQQRRYVAGLRGRKGSVFEGGVRVPCFMRFPGRLPQDVSIDTPAAHIDLLPTVLALCGIQAPADILLDGHNLLPLVEDKSVSWAERPLFFHWQRGFPEPYRNVAVRKGRYKLVGQSSHGARAKDFALFDLKKDPYEMENIQSTHPDITKEMIAEFDSWYEEMIESPHLNQIQRIKLGTQHENPVILNRNDAKGSEGIWAQHKIYGCWDVDVTEEGMYDFSFHFRENIQLEGVMKLRMGTLQRSLINPDKETSVLKIKGVPIKRGTYRLEPWYRAKGENYLPFYVEVKKRTGL